MALKAQTGWECLSLLAPATNIYGRKPNKKTKYTVWYDDEGYDEV